MHTVILPASCTRTAAQALLPELVAAMSHGPFAIDGSAVSQVGQAVLQLLVSARRSGEGATIAPSAALLDAAMLAGLAGELFDEVTA
ncbi:STAS domain-containing protein [Novosphingobium bradum]|uniref:STAS domain-containing protein n=1 Tax=Novosphingobium bradum TaxID=1737444 RepID=A0ABV7IM38_9SPHN